MSRGGRTPARADRHDRLRVVYATTHDHLPTLFTPDSRKGLANVRLYALGISERPVEDGFHVRFPEGRARRSMDTRLHDEARDHRPDATPVPGRCVTARRPRER